MKLLLVAALVCFVIALICAVSPTVIAGVGYVVWSISGFIAIVLAWLIGGHVDAAISKGRTTP